MFVPDSGINYILVQLLAQRCSMTPQIGGLLICSLGADSQNSRSATDTLRKALIVWQIQALVMRNKKCSTRACPPASSSSRVKAVLVLQSYCYIGLVSAHWRGFSSSVDHCQRNYFQDIFWRPKRKVNVSDSVRWNEVPRGCSSFI